MAQKLKEHTTLKKTGVQFLGHSSVGLQASWGLPPSGLAGNALVSICAQNKNKSLGARGMAWQLGAL